MEIEALPTYLQRTDMMLEKCLWTKMLNRKWENGDANDVLDTERKEIINYYSIYYITVRVRTNRNLQRINRVFLVDLCFLRSPIDARTPHTVFAVQSTVSRYLLIRVRMNSSRSQISLLWHRSRMIYCILES